MADREPSAERFQELKGLADLRLTDLSNSSERLSNQADRLSRRSTWLGVVVIVLGALVATRGVADQLMVDFESRPTLHLVIIVGYTMIGLSISAAAGLEAAFQFTRKAVELGILSSRALSLSRGYMSDILVEADPRTELDGAIAAMEQIVHQQNLELAKIYEEAATLGVNLAFGAHVDYAK